MKKIKKQKGFTLIELMITVAIAGTLSTLAYSSYRDQIIRSEIVGGITSLSSYRVKMEQYFQDNRTYDGGCALASGFNTSKFTMSCSTPDAETYTLTATSDNFVFTLDQANNKKTTAVPSGWTQTDDCWVVNKTGSCQ